jgi:predicted N-acetyltransferase YhbS
LGAKLFFTPQDVFLALPLDGRVPQGIVIFHEAFQATG